MWGIVGLAFLIAGLIKANVTVMGIAAIFAVADSIDRLSLRFKKDKKEDKED